MQTKPTSKSRQRTSESQDRLTLEEYMQAYKIRKKIEQRNRSRSKGKEQSFQKQQQRNQKNIFLKLDKYLQQTKIELTQNINNNLQTSREKLFFHISKILDKLIIDLKGEISKLYKDVYTHYKVSLQKLQSKDPNMNDNFFKQKKEQAKQQMLRTHKVDAMKEHIRIQNKNTQIIKNLFQILEQQKKNQKSNNLPQKQQQKQNNGKASAAGIMDFLASMVPAEQKNTVSKEQKCPILPKNTISAARTNSELNKIRAFQRKPQAGFRPFSKDKR